MIHGHPCLRQHLAVNEEYLGIEGTAGVQGREGSSLLLVL